MAFISDTARKWVIIPLSASVVVVALVVGSFWLTDGFKTSEPLGVDYSPRYYELAAKTTYTQEERDELELERCKGEKLMLEEVRARFPQHADDLEKKYNENCAKHL